MFAASLEATYLDIYKTTATYNDQNAKKHTREKATGKMKV